MAKKILFGQIGKTLLAAIDSAGAQYRQACRELAQQHRQRSWHEWLQHQARLGDAHALAALRARPCAKGLKGNTLGGEAMTTCPPSAAPQPDSITKQGTLIYRFGEATIRDSGNALQVSRHATPEAVITALKLAIERFGQPLSVNGSAEFKQQVIALAAQERLTICFKDSSLEKQRLALLASTRQQSGKKASQGIRR